MKAKLVRIGNSRGVRLPKVIIDQAGLGDEVELVVQGGRIILGPVPTNPREGWDEAFRRAIAKYGRDEPDENWQLMPNDFDKEGWTW